MATITFEIAGGSLEGNHRISRTLDDADVQRIISAYSAILGPLISGEGAEREERERTDDEVLEGMAVGALENILANVQGYERQQAARAASDAVQPIEIQQ